MEFVEESDHSKRPFQGSPYDEGYLKGLEEGLENTIISMFTHTTDTAFIAKVVAQIYEISYTDAEKYVEQVKHSERAIFEMHGVLSPTERKIVEGSN